VVAPPPARPHDGIAWLCTEAAGLSDLPLDELCDRLLSELPEALDDDVAILALRAYPEPV
jgi:hypothetical protein